MLTAEHPQQPRAIVRLGASLLATLGLALASVVWSESWFYGRWRSEDTALGIVETVAVYALAVQVVRFVTVRWRVAASGSGAWKRVFLAGALYGWLVEGIIVTTVVDDLPLSISYTGLAWHALFTVLLGWWWLPRQLERAVGRSIVALVALGAGIGCWASFWRFEEGAVTPVLDYAIFMTLSTLAYAIGLAVWWRFRGRAHPGLRGSMVAIVLLAILAVIHAITNPITLMGPVLVALALVAIIFTIPAPPSVPALSTGGPEPWRALWRLVVIPVVATGVFALITAAPEAIPTGWVFYAVTVPLATVLFGVAWWGSRRSRRGAAGSTL